MTIKSIGNNRDLTREFDNSLNKTEAGKATAPSAAQIYSETMLAAIAQARKERALSSRENFTVKQIKTELDTKLAHTAKRDHGIVKSVDAAASAQDIADDWYKFSYHVDYSTPLAKAYFEGLQHVIGSVLLPDLNPNGKPIDPALLIDNTKDLRDKIRAAQNGDAKAAAKLEKLYGYTPDTAPRPGQMWLAANYVAGDLDNGAVKAKNFPAVSAAHPINTAPPDVNELLFNNKRGVTLKNSAGKQVSVHTPVEYDAIVAANRAKAGLPIKNGAPIPVHVTFEGGGGFGKRHAPALAEMYNLGLVPASVSGTSAGAITAGMIAAGLSPSKADEVSKDPAIEKFFDTHPFGGPGLLAGREFYRYMDKKLREITGIKDRPVTFADLPIPLYINCTKLADSEAPNDMTRVEDRIVVFSKETTPDTPVAMAMTASAAVPGSLDPVDFIDVATGRKIRLCDGGIVHNLPLGLQNNDLPEIAIKLDPPNISNPNASYNNAQPKPLPAGNLDSYNPFINAQYGIDLYMASGDAGQNFHDRYNPKAGQFIFSVPTWNLKNFVKQDTVLDYQYDRKIDPELDKQTTALTDDFLRRFIDKLADKSASGTNLKPLPADTSFSRTFTYNREQWQADYQAGSDYVNFHSAKGESHRIKLGAEQIVNWLADDASFGDLGYRLRDVIADHENYLRSIGL